MTRKYSDIVNTKENRKREKCLWLRSEDESGMINEQVSPTTKAATWKTSLCRHIQVFPERFRTWRRCKPHSINQTLLRQPTRDKRSPRLYEFNPHKSEFERESVSINATNWWIFIQIVQEKARGKWAKVSGALFSESLRKGGKYSFLS